MFTNKYITILIIIMLFMFVFYRNIEPFIAPALINLGARGAVIGLREGGVIQTRDRTDIEKILSYPDDQAVAGIKKLFSGGTTTYSCPSNKILIPKQYCPRLNPDLPDTKPCCSPQSNTVQELNNMELNSNTIRSRIPPTRISAYMVKRKIYIFVNDAYFRCSLVNGILQKNSGYPKIIRSQYGTQIGNQENICAMFMRSGTGKPSKDGVVYMFTHRTNKYFKYKSSTNTIVSTSNPTNFRISNETWPSAIVQANSDDIYFFTRNNKYYIYPNKGGPIQKGYITSLLYPKNSRPCSQCITAACKHPDGDSIYLFQWIAPRKLKCYRYRIISQITWLLHEGYPYTLTL